MARSATSARIFLPAISVLLLVLSACGSTSGGGGGAAGATIGAPCNSALQKELCNGTARLACISNVWAILATCPSGQKCVVTPAADGKGMQSGCLDSGSGGDAVSGDGQSLDGTTGDVSTVDSSPDVQEVGGTDAAVTDDGTCTNGQACDDGDGCTQNDHCTGGQCNGTPTNCDDSDPCTADSCSGGSCQHTAVTCADGTTTARRCR